MRKKKRNQLFSILIILGIFLPGIMGIFAVQARAVEDQTINAQRALQAGATSTSTFPALTSAPLFSSTPTNLPLNPLSGISVDLYVFIQAPTRPVSKPYVVLTAFASIPRTGSVEIRGFLNNVEFVCSESPCVIYLQSSSRLVFRAYANTGETSNEVVSSVTLTQQQDKYQVTIDTVSQYTAFTDSCSRVWGVRDETNATWSHFAQFPFLLNTSKTLHALATKLILNGVVNTSSCPAGGLNLGLDWPTACGLDKVTEQMIAWQNQYDGYIWLASRDHGIPPKILKTLLEFESQFWPGNSRFYLDEIGLGQINELGVDVLLRQDPTYYQRVCPAILIDCTHPYSSLSPDQQKQIRGALVQSVDATCATCDFGLDLDKAKQSVDLIGALVYANCQQVEAILQQPYKADTDVEAATATAAFATFVAGGAAPGPTYEDLWRFTLLSYHSGVSCFQQSVANTRKQGLSLTWDNMVNNLACKGARDYVNGFMDNLLSFDTYLFEPGDALSAYALPSIVPTRTAVPTPTVFESHARIIVNVYIDHNGNGIPDTGEGVDAMTVQVTINNTQKITQRTQNGVAIFDMSGYPPNAGIEVSLPGLYRSQVLRLPAEGDVSVEFKFDQPTLPTVLP